MVKRKTLLFASILLIALVGLWGIKVLKKDVPKATETTVPEKQYDVIVIGGEPEGVAAAVSAARNGAKTLLVERRDDLGGLFTYGMLNFLDIPQGEDGESVSQGIFKEWHALVGGGSAFGIEEGKSAFRQLVENESNLSLMTETTVSEAILEENRVAGVELTNEHGTFKVKGKAFIDATQDADFAVMAGAPYFVGGEDIGIKHKKMSVTLMIHLKNLDWERIKETAASEKFGSAVVTDKVAWGFSALHHVYMPVEENTRLRGLNLAKINDEYFINALQLFGVDGLDEESKKAAIEKGKRETENILAYLQKEFPGFENAEIASFPSELYVRETRHIWAEYQLPMSDVWTNRDHWDNIGYGGYPVDIQAQTPQDYGYIVADPKQYAIPFRSLVPKEIDGLLVVGRAAGYSSIAAGSARVVPTGMTTGEAAGAAAALAIEEKVTFRELSRNEGLIEALRDTLTKQGAFVKHIKTSYPYEGEWYDESIQTLIDYGLIFGRYDNDMKVDEVATTHAFMNMVKEILLRVDEEGYFYSEDELATLYDQLIEKEDRPITRDEAAGILAQLLYKETGTTSWGTLLEQQVISDDLANRISEDQELTLKEMFAINASFIHYLKLFSQ
ncbi:FAD-dependent oxidoreductase [Robertmurraya andreesenii]|uniref:Flavin-dependent dehydrogenase n=1 Tax=Anoxybacillus andreesenii TaxID=1325932 RepID=A0ABT9UZT2_9BACL|nr:FAD-dependent oxidoreductase [Robertmurraya andreesenii]MDQ0154213.1 flavin-dependent dehydrogenase [Robertmurraya andreesenii]